MTLEDIIGDKFLRLGDSGTEVQQAQLALRTIGYALKGTGYFGAATDVATETYQKRAGLAVDGVFGRLTARSIDMALSQISVGAVPSVVPPAQIGRPLWLEAGIKLVGTKEFAGSKDNPVIIDWAKDEGGSIAEDYTHDSIPWCALFANHCLTKVGVKGTETLWALDFNADLMQKRLGRSWPAVQLSGPAVGAFAPMTRKTATGTAGHIIQVVGRDQHGNIMGLGGNQNDAVSVAPFVFSRLNKGFWWPKGVSLPTSFGLSKLPLVNSSGNLLTNLA